MKQQFAWKSKLSPQLAKLHRRNARSENRAGKATPHPHPAAGKPHEKFETHRALTVSTWRCPSASAISTARKPCWASSWWAADTGRPSWASCCRRCRHWRWAAWAAWALRTPRARRPWAPWAPWTWRRSCRGWRCARARRARCARRERYARARAPGRGGARSARAGAAAAPGGGR